MSIGNSIIHRSISMPDLRLSAEAIAASNKGLSCTKEGHLELPGGSRVSVKWSRETTVKSEHGNSKMERCLAPIGQNFFLIGGSENSYVLSERADGSGARYFAIFKHENVNFSSFSRAFSSIGSMRSFFPSNQIGHISKFIKVESRAPIFSEKRLSRAFQKGEAAIDRRAPLEISGRAEGESPSRKSKDNPINSH